MTGQMDHASNPKARRKAREGEKAMHAERQRATATVTPDQARARLDGMAPWPDPDGAGTVTVARWIAVRAQRAYVRSIQPAAAAGDDGELALAWWAAGRFLTAIAAHDAAESDAGARMLRLATGGDGDDADGIGERLAALLASLAVDAGEISRLEAAATSGRPAAPQSPPDAPLRIVHAIASATVSRLASAVPVAADGEPEEAARLRYASRMLADIASMTGVTVTAGDAEAAL